MVTPGPEVGTEESAWPQLALSLDNQFQSGFFFPTEWKTKYVSGRLCLGRTHGTMQYRRQDTGECSIPRHIQCPL